MWTKAFNGDLPAIRHDSCGLRAAGDQTDAVDEKPKDGEVISTDKHFFPKAKQPMPSHPARLDAAAREKDGIQQYSGICELNHS